MTDSDTRTRRQILKRGLRLFAERGYAATAVQDIVDAAGVTKPTLYYYFGSKAGLYQALVESAHDERYRLMQEAAARTVRLEDKLVEIVAALFEFLRRNRDLMRIAFATAFAAPGELPKELRYLDRCSRNFEFIHALVKRGLAERILDRKFDSRELAFGLYGLLNIYIMAHLLMPECPLNRQTAVRVVELFLDGAAAQKHTVPRTRSS
jgi:AcrR family transcriptional regulator